jgi:hypothetical protein
MVKAKAQQLEPAEQGYRMLLRGIDCFEASLLLVDTAQPGWPLLHANTSWGGLTGGLGAKGGGCCQSLHAGHAC